MYGEEYRCSDCNFEFCTGLSHHSKGQHLVCSNCATYFLARTIASTDEQSPKQEKLIQCGDHENIDSHDKDTGITIYRGNEFLAGKDTILMYNLHESLAKIVCPSCNTLGSIVQVFEDGTLCPKCSTGTIKYAGTCVY